MSIIEPFRSRHSMRRDRADGNRRGAQAFRAALVIIGLLQLAAPTRGLAQNADLEPRLVEPALWLAIPSEIVSLPAAEQVATERPMSFPVMAGASTLGSAVGAGAGMLIGAGATDSLVGLLFAYPGAWLGATVGADVAGASRGRAILGSTVGLFLGAAVAAAGGDEWTWAGIGVHGLVTALLSGSVDP
ncbi:hypothetical protein V3331_18125 [Gaopeijia maritima]|uniref:hypothetical protein n=1 Tax=Gaopeijia maritima TaxID=3119007 RepID=UPI0032451B60